MLLSNLYLHYVLDQRFESVVKRRLRSEAYLVRYLDDFVLCFQYRANALRVQEALRKRPSKLNLKLELSKTKLAEIGCAGRWSWCSKNGNSTRIDTDNPDIRRRAELGAIAAATLNRFLAHSAQRIKRAEISTRKVAMYAQRVTSTTNFLTD